MVHSDPGVTRTGVPPTRRGGSGRVCSALEVTRGRGVPPNRHGGREQGLQCSWRDKKGCPTY